MGRHGNGSGLAKVESGLNQDWIRIGSGLNQGWVRVRCV